MKRLFLLATILVLSNPVLAQTWLPNQQLTISPRVNPVLSEYDTLGLKAFARTSRSVPVASPGITWTVSNNTVATLLPVGKDSVVLYVASNILNQDIWVYAAWKTSSGTFRDSVAVTLRLRDPLTGNTLIFPRSQTLSANDSISLSTFTKASPASVKYRLNDTTNATITLSGKLRVKSIITSTSVLVYSTYVSGNSNLVDSVQYTLIPTPDIVPVPNYIPTAKITSPYNGEKITTGGVVTFDGLGIDLEDGDLSNTALTWTSDRVGVIGTGKHVSRVMEVGEHTITLSAKDSKGLVGTYSVKLIMEPALPPDASPTVRLITTSPTITVVQNTYSTFAAVATDPEDGELSNSIRWTSDRDGNLGIGPVIQIASLSLGNHIVMATVTDSKGTSTSQYYTVTVKAPFAWTREDSIMRFQPSRCFRLEVMPRRARIANQPSNVSITVESPTNSRYGVEAVFGSDTVCVAIVMEGNHFSDIQPPAPAFYKYKWIVFVQMPTFCRLSSLAVLPQTSQEFDVLDNALASVWNIRPEHDPLCVPD